MVDRLHRRAPGRSHRGSRQHPTGRARAPGHPHPCRTDRPPGQCGYQRRCPVGGGAQATEPPPGGGHHHRRPRNPGLVSAVRYRLLAAASSRRWQRVDGHHVHLGHHRRPQGGGGAAPRSQPGRSTRRLERARLHDLIPVLHHQRRPARLRSDAGRAERLVPTPLRPRSMALPGGAAPAGGRVRGPGHGPAHRGASQFRTGRSLEPGRPHHRRRPHHPGHPAAPG